MSLTFDRLFTGTTVEFDRLSNTVAAGLKWNPGFYMASNNLTFPDDRHLADQVLEQNLVLSSGANVLGWKGYYYPAALQGSTLGVYDFSKIVRDLNAMRSMSTPKRFMIDIIPQLFNSTTYTDVLPSAVYLNSSFGPSPIANRYGFWTMNGGNDLTIAWWRPAVMDWIIDLFTALASYVNTTTSIAIDLDPYVEHTSFGEVSMGVDTPSDFNPADVVTQYKRLIDAINSTWLNTVHMCQNNFTGTQAEAQDLTNYCVANRTAVGGPDTVPNSLSWGQKAVLGVAQSDPNFAGPDLRGTAAMIADTQSPELSQSGKAWTPSAIFAWTDQTLWQSHWIVACLDRGATNPPNPAYPGQAKNTGTNPGNWNSVLQVMNASTLAHTAKPTSIP